MEFDGIKQLSIRTKQILLTIDSEPHLDIEKLVLAINYTRTFGHVVLVTSMASESVKDERIQKLKNVLKFFSDPVGELEVEYRADSETGLCRYDLFCTVRDGNILIKRQGKPSTKRSDSP